MNEREMQELLWQHPERLLHEPLEQFAWETSSPEVGRADLVFEDRHGRFLIIEVKRGKLPRGAIDQLLDYFGMMKRRFPNRPVEMMVVANSIPSERRLTCESRDIECREISEKTFRDVAAEVGYSFTSEANLPQRTPEIPIIHSNRGTGVQKASEGTSGWSFGRTADSAEDARDFLSRCDDAGKNFFNVLFESQKGASTYTKITWKHESGFSLQFYFDRLGFAPLVWGFPAKNRDGKGIRQRLDFPFNFSLRTGVSEAFINEFGASLSSVAPFSGGGKRPSIPISALGSDESAGIIETIFRFAAKASNK